MLVLGRYVGESIKVFDEKGSLVCEFSINKVIGRKVKIGIDANQNIRIVRSELKPISGNAVARSCGKKLEHGSDLLGVK